MRRRVLVLSDGYHEPSVVVEGTVKYSTLSGFVCACLCPPHYTEFILRTFRFEDCLESEMDDYNYFDYGAGVDNSVKAVEVFERLWDSESAVEGLDV